MTNAILAHLREHLGPEEELLISREGVSVWSWAGDEAGTRVVATVGMSRLAQRLPEGIQCVSAEPRVELLMQVSNDDAWQLAKLLRDLADYPGTHGCFLHWYHVLPIGRPLRDGSPLTSLLLTFPGIGGEGFATFSSEGNRVDVVWVVPISESEREFFKENGVDALEDLFEEEGIDVADLMRRSVV